MWSYQSIDQKIILTVQAWRRPILNKLFLYLTYMGTGKSWFTFALIANVLNLARIQFVPNQVQFLRAMFCPLIAWLLGIWIKKIISRQRPSELITGYSRIITSPTCGSFPSSHTSGAVAFYVALQVGGHPIAPYVGVWALLVSFSRLYLGVHYLSDIVGGAVLGTLISLAPAVAQNF